MLLRRNFLKFFYSTVEQGANFEKRIFLLNKEGKKISFWNDIPLKESSFQKDEFNICIEIPQHRIAKLELTKEEEFHPIKQDTRKNKFNKSETELRYYAQFPLFNYGFFPQTWESSLEKTPEGFLVNYDNQFRVDNLISIQIKKGDDDPLDILELGDMDKQPGQILKVKVLGCFCLIDQGEVDWKVLSINSTEAEKKNIQSLKDIERVYGGRLDAIKHWFKYIKTYDGKKANVIHYDEKIFDHEKALEIIHETHDYWKQLSNKTPAKNEELNEKKKKFHFI
ncbi:hypothetical protein ABPG74_020558 [Tetrahymena malaccensis]